MVLMKQPVNPLANAKLQASPTAPLPEFAWKLDWIKCAFDVGQRQIEDSGLFCQTVMCQLEASSRQTVIS